MSTISKMLTRTDIEKSLLISGDSFGIFPVPFDGGHFFNMTAIDGTGKAWDFPCFFLQSEGIVSVGWLPFLGGKDVRAGDMVFLHREWMNDGEDFTVKIEVKRKIRLLGQDIWAVLH
ncbi:hypothetical protein HRI_004947700 [Hibiscus trionum]|uniref:TF-B3 domain-containing protein n=1 Tax=Hibiscus trionum TaxID=183268 RepID=A0A9W7JDZ5_HIBTR|nr:hypothetical protein HRI_004947700 [Hibiscus trionum]